MGRTTAPHIYMRETPLGVPPHLHMPPAANSAKLGVGHCRTRQNVARRRTPTPPASTREPSLIHPLTSPRWPPRPNPTHSSCRRPHQCVPPPRSHAVPRGLRPPSPPPARFPACMHSGNRNHARLWGVPLCSRSTPRKTQVLLAIKKTVSAGRAPGHLPPRTPHFPLSHVSYMAISSSQARRRAGSAPKPPPVQTTPPSTPVPNGTHAAPACFHAIFSCTSCTATLQRTAKPANTAAMPPSPGFHAFWHKISK